MSESERITAGAYDAYLRHGVKGVFDFADTEGIKASAYCVPCDARMPVYEGVCLSCGTATPTDDCIREVAYWALQQPDLKDRLGEHLDVSDAEMEVWLEYLRGSLE